MSIMWLYKTVKYPGIVLQAPLTSSDVMYMYMYVCIVLLQADPATQIYVAPVGPWVELSEVSMIASEPTSTHLLGRQSGGDVRLTSMEDVTRAANELLDILCQ